VSSGPHPARTQSGRFRRPCHLLLRSVDKSAIWPMPPLARMSKSGP